MGKKAVRIFLAILPVVVIAGFARLVLGPHEATFKGRTVSSWLRPLVITPSWDDEPQEIPLKERAAVRELGPKVIPVALRMAGTHEFFVREIFSEISKNQKLLGVNVHSVSDGYAMAMAVFDILGPDGKPAVPALIKLMNNWDNGVRSTAANCLGAIGPPARDAVPALIAALRQTNNYFLQEYAAQSLGKIGPAAELAIPQLMIATTNPHPTVALHASLASLQIEKKSFGPFLQQLDDTTNGLRWEALAMIVGQLGTNAEPAIPLLISALANTNESIQTTAIVALRDIHLRPDLSVPALIPMLRPTNSLSVRHMALFALGRFGTKAKAAAPQLIQCLHDPAPNVQRIATNILRQIDPETAAKILSSPTKKDDPIIIN